MSITSEQYDEGIKIKKELTRVLEEVFANTHQWYSDKLKEITVLYAPKGDHRGESAKRALKREFMGKMEKLNRHLHKLQKLTPEKAYKNKSELEHLIKRRFEDDVKFKHRYSELAGILSVVLFSMVLLFALSQGHAEDVAKSIFITMVVGFFLIAVFIWWTRNNRQLTAA